VIGFRHRDICLFPRVDCSGTSLDSASPFRKPHNSPYPLSRPIHPMAKVFCPPHENSALSPCAI
jgi:hypothetical protein